MDLLEGGDLRYHMCLYGIFDELTTSKYLFLLIFLTLLLNLLEFFVASLIEGL